MNRKLKLYVWEGVLKEWTTGVMFALAGSAREARAVIRKQIKKDGRYESSVEKDLKGRPQVFSSPRGGYCRGSA